MSEPTTTQAVRDTILATCADGLTAFGYDPATLADDFDLREHGIIDSLGFLEIVTALEDELGIELELGSMPAEQLTVLGPLSAEVARQAGAQRDSTAAMKKAA